MLSVCRTKFFYVYCSNLKNYKKENRHGKNVIIYKKNDFAKISKNLARSESILHHQNNCVRSMMSNVAKIVKIVILATRLNVLHNYFDSSMKLFSRIA